MARCPRRVWGDRSGTGVGQVWDGSGTGPAVVATYEAVVEWQAA